MVFTDASTADNNHYTEILTRLRSLRCAESFKVTKRSFPETDRNQQDDNFHEDLSIRKMGKIPAR